MRNRKPINMSVSSPFDKLRVILDKQKDHPMKTYDKASKVETKTSHLNMHHIRQFEQNNGPSRRYFPEKIDRDGKGDFHYRRYLGRAR